MNIGQEFMLCIVISTEKEASVIPKCVCLFVPLPVCRYPPVSGHQGHVTQLPGPQVALHLTEGDVGMGQSSEHTLLRTSTWLQWNAGGQCGAAVGRPVPTHGNIRTQTGVCVDTDIHRKRQKQTKADRGFECMHSWSLLLQTTRQMCGERELQQLLCVFHVQSFSLYRFFSHTLVPSFTFQQGYCVSPEADKGFLMVQLLGVNGQINLAHLKEKLPIK